ncbi:hypothetical protein V6N13_086304 [Hibiscus sabdariffa]
MMACPILQQLGFRSSQICVNFLSIAKSSEGSRKCKEAEVEGILSLILVVTPLVVLGALVALVVLEV